MIRLRVYKGIFLFCMLLMAGCSSLPFLIPNPPESGPDSSADDPPEEDHSNDAADFGAVFEPDLAQDSQSVIQQPVIEEESIRVSRTIVRIALHQNLSRTVFYSSEPVKVSGDGRSAVLRGRIEITPGANRSCRISSVSSGKITLALPCTVKTSSLSAKIESEGKAYRGHLCVVPGEAGGLTVINILPVEHYLRGVVPLEIGYRPESEIEAVKAQAVAARTYSYKRMAQRNSQPWDMLPTVSDQVYGGAAVEDEVADRAIAATGGLVLAYGDSLVHAYYHSTCGGKTANIQDVWGKGAQPYLISIDDLDEHGEAYCRSSRYFTWSEKWNTKTLSSILHKYAKTAFPDREAFDGRLAGVRIEQRFTCGRIRSCAFRGSRGTVRYGTDKIRFALRRNLGDAPILRSANFSFDNVSSQAITIHGKGYGHGVGMCQVGAMGRARAGQTCRQILSAYYPQTRLVATVRE